MTILVTGANGQLGRELRQVSRSSRNRYVFSDVSDVPGLETLRLDVTDADAVRSAVKDLGAEVIINCAAYTDVNQAESDESGCRLLNAVAPENLAAAMKETGGLLVHISTDYVFSGENIGRPYSEDMPCDPLNVYGKTKREGEAAVIASGCRSIIIRTSWLYSVYGRNFVKTMLELTSTRAHVDVISDQTGSPTYALDLAEVIYDILESGKACGNEGIYHYSNEGVCTWYDFALAIAGFAGHDGCEISPCDSGMFPSPARRPSYSVLDKSRIRAVFGIQVPHWKDSLKKCLNNLA